VKNVLSQLKKQLSDPIKFSEALGMLKGKPFSLKERKHLHDIYRDKHPRVVVVAGRQVEKSETVVRIMLHRGYTRPFTTILYTSPRIEQVTRFVNDRFRPSIRDSRQGILEKSVSKNRDAKTAVGLTNRSVFYFASSWQNADATRGISGDIVFFDECQDLTQTAIETVEKSVSHSEIYDPNTELRGICFYTGTPKESGSYYDRVLWGMSDQKRWKVKCIHCEYEQFMSMDNIIEQSDERAYFGCLKCKKELDRSNGQWVATRPENTLYSGYHLTQLIMPWIPASQILRDFKTMDISTFKNEVLGEFHSGNVKPISIQDILSCTDPNRSLRQGINILPSGFAEHDTVMGIDYGSGGLSKTIITIGHMEFIDNEKKLVIDHIENCKIENLEELLRHICELKERFKVKKILGDIGYGSWQAQKLYEYYGRDATAIRYVTFPTDPEKRVYKDKYVLQVDRTYSMDRLIDMFKKRKIVIPYRHPEKVEPFFDDYMAIETVYKDSSTTAGKKLYTHTIPDDAFHSLNYVREGIQELENRFSWEGIEKPDYVEYDLQAIRNELLAPKW
jgi:hypothetical protein